MKRDIEPLTGDTSLSEKLACWICVVLFAIGLIAIAMPK
jgi:hypothetical protein